MDTRDKEEGIAEGLICLDVIRRDSMFFNFIVPKGFRHEVMDRLCTEKRHGKLDFQALFVQDAYISKGRKSVWRGNIS